MRINVSIPLSYTNKRIVLLLLLLLILLLVVVALKTIKLITNH